MDPRLARIMLLALSGRSNYYGSRRVEEFIISKGITPDLRFDQVSHAHLALIGADLNLGKPVIYGQDPSQSVLEGIMASIAIPPWFAPLAKDGHTIMDGGALSNLPIEPAMALGATEIIALYLGDPNGMLGIENLQSQQLERLLYSVNHREACLEMALAAARNIPVHYIPLKSSPPTPIWDFRNYRQLFQTGYETMLQEISGWSKRDQSERILLEHCMENQPSWISD